MAEVRWEEHPEGLLFYLREGIQALVAFRTATQYKVTLWSEETMMSPDVGDFNRASFRKRLSKAAAESFRLDEVAAKGIEHDLGEVAFALGKQLEDENGDGTTLADILKGLGGPSVAQLLVKYGSEGELFHDAEQEAYATVEVGGHQETYALRSKAYRSWLRHRYFTGEKEAGDEDPAAPRAQTLADAINQLEARAQFEGPEYAVFVRLAEHEGNIYLDLADEAWRCVEITPQGWRVMAEPPVKFVRPKGMAPLPVPTPGGSVEELRELTNLQGDAWRLAVAWLISALHPQGPYPIFLLKGEQGSSKSTTERMLRAVVDPSTAPLRTTPRNEHDLYIAGTSSWVVAFDNISKLADWLSDALCRLATGGGFSTRTLYENREQELFDATRPAILNGIGDVATRPDLLDRAIIVSLLTIPKNRRRSERELWAEFETKLPGILGALLDAVSIGLRNLPTTELDYLPRMADFATWIAAAEEGLGWESGTFLRAYENNRAEANQQALESSPLAIAVWRLMRERDEWSGTSTQLLEVLNRVAKKEEREDYQWPRAANALSAELNRIAPALREGVGIEYVDKPREGREGRRVKKLFWIKDPEEDRQHRQQDENPAKESQKSADDPPFRGSSADRQQDTQDRQHAQDADDPPLFADDPLEGSSADRRYENPIDKAKARDADDADGPDDDLRGSYREENSSPPGGISPNGRLTIDEVLEEINRSGSGAATNAELHRRGEITEENAIEWITKAILDSRGEPFDDWEHHAPAVRAALTHPLDCNCEECL